MPFRVLRDLDYLGTSSTPTNSGSGEPLFVAGGTPRGPPQLMGTRILESAERVGKAPRNVRFTSLKFAFSSLYGFCY
ncbi:MAG TPA: hypothetical protein DHW54_03330 [Gemmatimonadetes bacterium]|nr:hypothetical protein [Gemmatimonadota bacterium]